MRTTLVAIIRYTVNNLLWIQTDSNQWRIQGSRAPLIFRPNWGPKGRKKFFWRLGPPPPPPYLRVWVTAPHLSQGLDRALAISPNFLNQCKIFILLSREIKHNHSVTVTLWPRWFLHATAIGHCKFTCSLTGDVASYIMGQKKIKAKTRHRAT